MNSHKLYFIRHKGNNKHLDFYIAAKNLQDAAKCLYCCIDESNIESIKPLSLPVIIVVEDAKSKLNIDDPIITTTPEPDEPIAIKLPPVETPQNICIFEQEKTEIKTDDLPF